MTGSVSFDRIADAYDETRGGTVRGRHFAGAVAPHVTGARRVFEIGIGTGAIALPLRELGHDVVGVDISPAMLARAQDRLGNRVAIGDAGRLPVADESCEAIVAVWVLHLVGDPHAVLAECARVLRAGGRLAVVHANADEESTDLSELILELHHASGRRREVPEHDALRLVHRGRTPLMAFDEPPNRTADVIEGRTWSWLWDVDDDTWATRFQPVVDRIRALPDPDRPRPRRQTHPLLVFER